MIQCDVIDCQCALTTLYDAMIVIIMHSESIINSLTMIIFGQSLLSYDSKSKQWHQFGTVFGTQSHNNYHQYYNIVLIGQLQCVCTIIW